MDAGHESLSSPQKRYVIATIDCKQSARRYERRADHLASFVVIAAALICYRRLANSVTVLAGIVLHSGGTRAQGYRRERPGVTRPCS